MGMNRPERTRSREEHAGAPELRPLSWQLALDRRLVRRKFHHYSGSSVISAKKSKKIWRNSHLIYLTALQCRLK
jgi:hypothetical protein